ncbi:hypothetical protein N7E70_021875 [Aminobacter sp. NyZ550]|uniref:hypothetical protein n=1 Tax=Aminobacter sp. NyZ550 TaxID=2979870 RepID=UPI0021D56C8F|nr:hypothetical protein [Aminobacter sp. NyZ550]WAX94295.1 hypothetical protein N7E70_021875 [Aminobacter sp. NyZ550]
MLASSAAAAAGACPAVSQAAERGKLQQLLSSNGVPKAERAFLLAGAEQRLKEMQPSALNADGAQCGIKVVRAHVLGCMNAALAQAFRTTPADKPSVNALWGRAGLSARGALFVGIFHACRGAAAETFLSR